MADPIRREPDGCDLSCTIVTEPTMTTVRVPFDNLRCTVSYDDVLTLLDENGEAIFRQHQPGAYEMCKSAVLPGVSIGFRTDSIECATLVPRILRTRPEIM